MSSESSSKAGIHFVCSSCDATLDHIGHLGLKSLSEIPKNCRVCGREITFNVNPDLVKIYAAKRL
jgi:hypothetical protein